MTVTPLRGHLVLLPLLALLAWPAPALAQFSGAIQGTITDSQKALVADAIVTVTHTESGVTRESITSSDGVFRVLSLGPGTYRVQVVKPGFLTAQRDTVTVGISETARVDFTLDVSGVAESVTVTTNDAVVETEQGRVSGRVDRLQLQEMPLSGRNLYNLIALQPGVTGKGVSASISGGGGAWSAKRASAARKRSAFRFPPVENVPLPLFGGSGFRRPSQFFCLRSLDSPPLPPGSSPQFSALFQPLMPYRCDARATPFILKP